MALVVLSVVEQRLDAVRAMLSGAKVTEVAAALGVSRQSVHSWVARYLAEGLAGLADKSHRPGFCPHQVAAGAEVTVVEMRRQRHKGASRKFRGAYGRTPRSAAGNIPWRRRRLVIGTGVDGALPVIREIHQKARRRASTRSSCPRRRRPAC